MLAAASAALALVAAQAVARAADVSAGTAAASPHTAAMSAHTAAGCTGRYLLECSEKTPAFADFVNWTNSGVLDTELFETKTPLHLSNPSLAQFWRFEASTATARSLLEYQYGNEVADQNFEAIDPIATLPKPSVPAHGIVDRRLARKLSRLMAAEQREVLDLRALDTALNRATAARYLRGREDWVKWQLSAAAGFAAKTAASIAPIIKAERAAGKALARHKLLFGVGSEDLKLAQRQVRAHGFAPKLVAIMQQLGLTATDIALARHQFETTNFGNLSFSLTQELYLPQVIAGQRGFAAALRHLAARIPPAGEPPA